MGKISRISLFLETELEPYKTLFDPQRWSDLIISFRLENYRIFQIPTQSVLSVAVQTGLSALKTPQCYSTNSKNPNCPVCQPNINEMAENLPFSHCAQSRLMCRVTKKPLNEYNLPMMLPNGQIFGQQVRGDMKSFEKLLFYWFFFQFLGAAWNYQGKRSSGVSNNQWKIH